MKYDAGEYDIAVVGAGHAGCEAALAAARMGMKTLLFSTPISTISACFRYKFGCLSRVCFISI